MINKDIKKSNIKIHEDFINIMKENLHNEDPKVGIFWYNPYKNELFGVVALSLDDPNNSKTPNGITCKILHKKKWQIEYNRLKFKEKLTNTYPYNGDYKDKPRGRIFYKDNIFYVMVGSWIYDDENYKAIDLIEETFDLTNENVEILDDFHWDIGSGWENF
jgi:hypothetical protein